MCSLASELKCAKFPTGPTFPESKSNSSPRQEPHSERICKAATGAIQFRRCSLVTYQVDTEKSKPSTDGREVGVGLGERGWSWKWVRLEGKGRSR